jgi:hypothetical protein
MFAHPGHELRLCGWLESVHPEVFILTDGSGHTGISQLHTSSLLLEQAGASRGQVYGTGTDRELYAAVIRQDYGPFYRLVDLLGETLSDPEVEYVVGNTMEGCDPAHDICRLLLDTAVALADQRRTARLGNFGCRLSGSPIPPATAPGEDLLRLDDGALARKLAAGLSCQEQAGEVRSALDLFGPEAFRHEYFPPVPRRQWEQGMRPAKAFYEIDGGAQAAAGRDHEVLSYQEHMRPLIAALRSYGIPGANSRECAS